MYEQRKRDLELTDNQLNELAKSYNADYKKLQDLNAQAARLKDKALLEMGAVDWLTAAHVWMDLVAESVPALLTQVAGVEPIEPMEIVPIEKVPSDPIARYVYTGHEWVTRDVEEESVPFPPVMPGTEAVKMISERVRDTMEFSQSQRINFESVRGEVNEQRGNLDVSTLEELLDVLEEINSILPAMYRLSNQYDILKADRKQPQEDEVAKAKKDWEDCLKQDPTTGGQNSVGGLVP